MRRKAQKNLGGWVLLNKIGRGGNSEVFLAKNDAGNEAALKLLHRRDATARQRFRDEIKCMQNNSDVSGIIPILDHCDFNNEQEPLWYVMPVATPIFKALQEESSEQIIKIIYDIAKTLKILHKRNISHRDIKPANILLYENIFCLSDFGLASFPDKDDLTKPREKVGPRWTIAPWMERDIPERDAKAADIYSLAKSLWILLTKEKQGFEGQYDPTASIGLKKYVRGIYLGPVDSLIRICTGHSSSDIPSIDEFCNQIDQWRGLNNNYQERNLHEWVSIIGKIFPFGIPSSSTWHKREIIVEVLKAFASKEGLNHTFLPNGGGLDLRDVKLSSEEGCLELHTDGQGIFILKPKRLDFESVNLDPEWTYLRLQADEIARVSQDDYNQNYEYLTRLGPSQYTYFEYPEDAFNAGVDLPEDVCLVTRVIKGSFLLFRKRSLYNRLSETYDKKYTNATREEFYNFIKKAADKFSKDQPDETPQEDRKPVFIEKTFNISRKNELNDQQCHLVKEIIFLAKERAEEARKITRKYYDDDEGVDFSEERAFKWLTEREPANEKLFSYLNKLSQEELEMLTAVMYGGRDNRNGGVPPSLHEIIRQFKGDLYLAGSLAEKSPLAEYLEKGLEWYGK